jgi:glutathione peroxidase
MVISGTARGNEGYIQDMSVYDFEATSIVGDKTPLERFRGKVLLIVNVASECGFTPQYEGLEKVYRKFRDQGFEVLGFPSNQFGHQEPGDDAAIKSFCETKFGVTFPMFSRIEVNGANAHPLYKYLKESRPGILGTEAIKWNFTKFLIDRNGLPIKRYAPQDKPEALQADIQNALGNSGEKS